MICQPLMENGKTDYLDLKQEAWLYIHELLLSPSRSLHEPLRQPVFKLINTFCFCIYRNPDIFPCYLSVP